MIATSYNGMPPEEIETEITGKFERFFTLGSGIDHMESRSLPGVSVIKVFFQPGTDADSDVNSISNLAMADLRRLPPGTMPPIILKFDASSLPVCLITLKGEGLSEATLRDIGQYSVRNQLAVVPGASIPQPFGGKYRQIMVYVDPAKLQAYQLSPMDVVRAVNNANLILPAGDVKIGALDYALYTNSQFSAVKDINAAPIKTVGTSTVTVGDLGWAEDGHQIQTNIVRVNGQPSVYLPIMKQGGDSNTIAVVDGIRQTLAHLTNIPKELVANVVFDQSLLGLDQREVVSNVITALTSNGMIAPSYWIDPKSGNDYMLTVQYPENQIRNLRDLTSMPLHARARSRAALARQAALTHQDGVAPQPTVARQATTLDAVSRIRPFKTPTEVDHYQIQRVIDIYVNPATEDLGAVASGVQRILAAEPPGIARVALRGMMVGMVVSNSILIVEFTHRLEADGMPTFEAVVSSCRIRLRPILMTSFATIIGLLPMALKLGVGSEAYAPLARSIIGGLLVSVVLTVFIVPAAYLVVYRRRSSPQAA